MYTRKIKYVDYDGNEREETFYFNLTKTELTQMDMIQAGGLESYINRIIESKNGKDTMEMFNLILSKSYGEKSLDGRRFIKSPELYKAFTETEAYNTFFYELVTDAKVAADFVNGVVSSVMDDIPEDKRREAEAKYKEMLGETVTQLAEAAEITQN